MWPFNRKEKSEPERASTFVPSGSVYTADYSVEETPLTELSDTDLTNLAACQERHKQMKEGTLLPVADQFLKTRWGQNRRNL